MRTYFHLAFGLLASLLTLLCGGAVWSVATQILDRDLPWMALILGLLAWPASTFLPISAALPRALLLSALTALSMLYAQVLAAAVAVARGLGVEFFETMRVLGAPTGIALAWQRSSAVECAWMLVGILAAAAIGIVTASQRR